jgi:Glycosyltransferase 61
LFSRLQDLFGLGAGRRPIEITYLEGVPFLEQIKYMTEIDILVTVHGENLTSVPFLPQCGGVVEFFPSSFYLPQWYGSLAAVLGLHHASLYSGLNHSLEWDHHGAVNFSSTTSRPLQNDVCVNVEETINAIREMEKKWTQCCSLITR